MSSLTDAEKNALRQFLAAVRKDNYDPKDFSGGYTWVEVDARDESWAALCLWLADQIDILEADSDPNPILLDALRRLLGGASSSCVIVDEQLARLKKRIQLLKP